MPTSPLRHRVTLLRTLFGSRSFELCRGVLNYGEQVASWRFVGQDHTPFTALEDLSADKTDGVIGNFMNEQQAASALHSGVQAVNVSSMTKIAAVPSVTCDDRAVGRMGAGYLLERGFVEFGYVGKLMFMEAQDQYEGFRTVLKEAGRACHVMNLQDEPEPESRSALAHWLRGLPRPIAIMAESDALACATLNTALDLHLLVPDDVAVLGVGNNPWSEVMTTMPLSSVDVNHGRIGQLAGAMLQGLMSGEVPPPRQTVPPLGVVARRSTDVMVNDDHVVTRVLQYIRDHAAHGISVDDVLDQVAMSRSTLDKRLKLATGQTVHTAICQMRVEKAKRMLVETDASVEQISHASGFQCQPRLNEMFKRLTGMTPGEYRRQRSR